MSGIRKDNYKPSMSETVCRWVYSLLLLLAIPIAMLALVRRGNANEKRGSRGWFERFGLVSRPVKEKGYLFHCVSVGEVVAASCLIKHIMEAEPDTHITVTTTTPTGAVRVRDIFGDKVQHFYLPYDLPFTMATMLSRIKPKAVFITEVELWPNLIHLCWKQNIPTMVVNARMTTRSAQRYGKISKLFTPMLHKLTHVCAQGQRDYENYLSLGIPPAHLTLTNNIKFDQASAATTAADGFLGITSGQYPVIVAGSTHEPEEQMILDSCHRLWQTHPELRVVIVPRHPQRFDSVAKLIQSHNYDFVRSSEITTLSDDSVTKLILLDEMGKLNHAYSIASIAFVGGSVADRGGHNALEPAAFSTPVLMGPHTYNNPVICEHLVARGALKIIEDASSFAAQCEQWLSNEGARRKAGASGRQVLDENKGALTQTLQCIERHITS